MRTPFCFACAGVLLVGALALGNPFLVCARHPKSALKAAPARGAAPLAASVVETSPPHPVPPGPLQAATAVDRPAASDPFPEPVAEPKASGPATSGKRDAVLQPAVLIGSAGGNAVGGSVVGGSVVGGSVVGGSVVGGSVVGDSGPGAEFEGLVVRSERDADGHMQWLLKDGRLLRRQGNRIVEVPRDGVQR